MHLRTTLNQLLEIVRGAFAGDPSAKRRRQCDQISKLVLSELDRLGFIYYQPGTKRKRQRMTRVAFVPPLIMTEDELWMPIDVARFPHKRPTSDLERDDVLESLRNRTHVSVRVDRLPTGNLCLVARLTKRQFPKMLPLTHFVLPADAPSTAIPLGVDEHMQPQVGDLAEIKHLLIAGATGGGKSSFLHTMLLTLIDRNGPEELELWLIDLKATELARYDKLRGTRDAPGIVRFFADDSASALETLQRGVAEIEKRNKLMQQAESVNLDEYNHETGARMRRIVIVIDEMAALAFDRTRVDKYTVGHWAQNLMIRIASQGRSSGVHLVIATQHINSEVLSPHILANYESRICFSTADWRKSQTVLETSEAVGKPAGRIFYRHAGRTQELQAPFASTTQIKLAVSRIAKHGHDGGLGHSAALRRFVENAKLILHVAQRDFEGKCPRDGLANADGIAGMISKIELEEILQKLERDGFLTPANKRTRQSRRIHHAFLGQPDMLETRYLPQANSGRRAGDGQAIPAGAGGIAQSPGLADAVFTRLPPANSPENPVSLAPTDEMAAIASQMATMQQILEGMLAQQTAQPVATQPEPEPATAPTLADEPAATTPPSRNTRRRNNNNARRRQPVAQPEPEREIETPAIRLVK